MASFRNILGQSWISEISAILPYEIWLFSKFQKTMTKTMLSKWSQLERNSRGQGSWFCMVWTLNTCFLEWIVIISHESWLMCISNNFSGCGIIFLNFFVYFCFLGIDLTVSRPAWISYHKKILYYTCKI